MPDRARYDVNNQPSLMAVSSADGASPVDLWADPTTHALVSSGGGGGGGASTIADGADVAEGATTDAAVTAGSAGTVSGKLRQISADVSSVKTNTTSIATAAKQDTGNTSIASIDTKTPALGQALAAASVPVILPSATITTLTPPAAITGFALDTSLTTIDTDLKSNITLHAGTNAIGNVGSSTATGSTVPANAFYNGVNPQTALPTAATAGNLTGATADKFGRAVVLPGTIRDLVGTQTTTISASTAETTVVTAAASTFNDLTALVISNTSATAARLDFRDTTGGSILFSIYVPAGDVRGVAFNRPVPQTSVNTNWTTQSSASITDLRVYAVFDKNK